MLVVSRSGFYDWLNRQPSRCAREGQRLLTLIRTSFTQSDATYGSPRVWDGLDEWGERCSRKRVARLMRPSGQRVRARRLRPPSDSGMRPEHCIAPNVLDRQFEAAGPNQKWVAYFTYIRTGEGWLYLAVVLDLFSRRAVGLSMSAQMTAQFVLDALMMAVWRRGKPNALLHHSDQGSQYSSEEFQRLLAEQNITCSMSRRSDCWDNAAMESFF